MLAKSPGDLRHTGDASAPAHEPATGYASACGGQRGGRRDPTIADPAPTLAQISPLQGTPPRNLRPATPRAPDNAEPSFLWHLAAISRGVAYLR